MPRLAIATAALGLALAAVPSARAQDDAPATRIEPLTPASTVRAGRPITFRVQTTAPAGSVVVRVSGSPRLDASGLLSDAAGATLDLRTAPGSEEAVHIARTSSSFLAARRPGPYFWQAYLTGDAAAGAEQSVGDVETLTVTAPRHVHRRLYPGYGPRGHASFYLSNRGFPSTVGGSRFASIARAAAKRWHLRARRWTSVPAGRADGFDVAGFGPLPSGVLGLETDYRIGGRTVEQDVRFNAAAPWSDGPGYPDFDEMDLESVVLHELGHMAGQGRHRSRCANSPMVAALGAGEWWRGPRDRWFFGCDASAASAAAILRPAPSAWRLARRVVELG